MLPTVKRILYASDLKENSRPAFRAAMSLCGHYHSHITYLHVIGTTGRRVERLVHEMMELDPSLKDMHDASMQDVRNAILKRVEGFCEAELDAHELLQPDQLDARVEEGEPWKEILRVADEIHASLIVMGTRHDHSLGKLLIGSVATKVMEHSKRPVLVVPLS
jgi:nucleotide-binding universal stress UspA family protein